MIKNKKIKTTIQQDSTESQVCGYDWTLFHIFLIQNVLCFIKLTHS